MEVVGGTPPEPEAGASEADEVRSPVLFHSPLGHVGLSGLVYISARPAVMKAGTFNNATGLVGVLPQAILCGTIMTSLSNRAMAAKKVENFLAYHALFPEFRVVWLGDSGQGDILVGQDMLRWAAALPTTTTPPLRLADGSTMPAHPPPPLVLIHDLRHTSQTPYNDTAARAAYAAGGVRMFDSYLTAAVHAFRAGLLSVLGLRAVAERTVADFINITCHTPLQTRLRADELLDALRDAKAAVAEVLAGASS